MESFYQYIEKALPDKMGDSVLYKFKKKTLDEMTLRANELTSRGLKDEKVINDLVISEYDDIVGEYKKYANEKAKAKKRKTYLIANIIGSVAYLLTMLILYFGISFGTKAWGTTWVIIADGILVWVSYILTLFVNRVMDMKRIFHFIGRILLAIDIMVISVAVFLVLMGVFHAPHSWLVIFGGIFSMFLADGIFALRTKQKLAIIFWLIYIPAMSAMLYVILSTVSVLSWSTGWLIIPCSIIVDLIISLVAIKVNNPDDKEVVDSWQEN